MYEKPRFSDELKLVALSNAIGCARIFVQYTLANWKASPFVVGDAHVITHELVTKAVDDTGVPEDQNTWSKVEKINYIVVRLLGFSRHIIVEVWDSAKRPAGLPDLHVVDTVALRWDSVVAMKTRLTWAEIPVYDRTDSGLPIREPRPVAPATGPAAPLSYEFLRRVRDRLTVQ